MASSVRGRSKLRNPAETTTVYPKPLSVVLRFSAPGAEVVFVVHAFLTPNGEIAASGMVDPKAVYLASQYQVIAIPDTTP